MLPSPPLGGGEEGTRRERDGEGEVAGRSAGAGAPPHLTLALSPQRAEREIPPG